MISWPRMRIAATILTAISMAPSDLEPSRLLREHEKFCFGVPRVICFSEYRYEAQQHEHVTTAEDCGGDVEGCMCSVCGSMAKQVIVQPQPVQTTTQEEDMADRVGEIMAKSQLAITSLRGGMALGYFGLVGILTHAPASPHCSQGPNGTPASKFFFLTASPS